MEISRAKQKEKQTVALPFSISKEEMLRSKILQPGVYVLLVKGVTQGPGKADPTSTTTTIDFVVESGPDPNGIGVPIRYWLSEKMVKPAIEFIEKITNKKLPEDGSVLPDLAIFIGRKIKAYIKPGKFNGRDNNTIDGFLPMGS